MRDYKYTYPARNAVRPASPEHLIYPWFQSFLFHRYCEEKRMLTEDLWYIKHVDFSYDLLGKAIRMENNLWYIGLVSGFDGTDTVDEKIKFWIAYIFFDPYEYKYRNLFFEPGVDYNFSSRYFSTIHPGFDDAKTFSKELSETGAFITLLELHGLVFIAGVVKSDITEIRVGFPNREVKKFSTIDNIEFLLTQNICENATRTFFGILGKREDFYSFTQDDLLEVSLWKEEMQLHNVHFLRVLLPF